jgi:hypothetical protein
MYRPQYAHPLAPSPCEQQTCQYSFDSTNLPALAGTLAAGARTGRIPLKMDKDAPFYLRSIMTQGSVSLRLEDPNRNPLSDSENATESINYEIPSEWSQTQGAGFAALESGSGGLFAPSGSTFVVYLYNGTAATIELQTVAINLKGVKQYDNAECAG